LQTSVIADESGGKNVGKTNSGNEEVAFLASAIMIREGRINRRRRLQMQLALNNRGRILNLVCLLLLLIPKGTSDFLVQFVPVVGFFKIHYFCHFLSKRRLPVGHRTACFSNPLHAHRFQIRNTTYRSGLCKSSKYISCSRSKRNTYLPAIPAIFVPKQSKQALHA